MTASRGQLKALYQADQNKYILKILEELGEFQTALLHFLDGKVTGKELAIELADLEIQAAKASIFVPIDSFLQARKDQQIKFSDSVAHEYGIVIGEGTGEGEI